MRARLFTSTVVSESLSRLWCTGTVSVHVFGRHVGKARLTVATVLVPVFLCVWCLGETVVCDEVVDNVIIVRVVLNPQESKSLTLWHRRCRYEIVGMPLLHLQSDILCFSPPVACLLARFVTSRTCSL